MEHSTGTIHAFRHALLRDVAYELQVPSDRAVLHHAALQAIEQLVPESERDPLAGELAGHARQLLQHPFAGLEPAERDRISLKELAYLKRATKLAEQAYDNELAAEYCRRCTDHPAATSEDRIDALFTAGRLLSLSGRIDAGEAAFTTALGVAEEIGDDSLTGAAHTGLGTLYRETGRVALAEEHLRQAANYCARGEDRESEASARISLGALLLDKGNISEAEACYRDAIGLLRKIGSQQHEGAAVSNLAVLLKSTGRLEQAQQTYEESLALHRATGNLRMEGITLGNLAALLRALGRTTEAEEMFRKALAIVRQVGDRRSEGVILGNLPIMLKLAGRFEEAEDMYRQALRLLREIGERRHEGYALGNLGALFQDTGRLRAGIDALEAGVSAFRDVEAGLMVAAFGCILGTARLLSGDVPAAAAAAEHALEVVDESRAVLHRVEYALRLKLRVALARDDLDTADDTLAEMRRLVTGGNFGPETGAGKALEECERMLHEASESKRDGRPVQLYAGHLPGEMQPLARLAVIDRLKKQHPAEFARLKETNSQLVAAMLIDTERLNPPDWAAGFVDESE